MTVLTELRHDLAEMELPELEDLRDRLTTVIEAARRDG